jgi:Flp pilus assembly protein protease CpaA
VPQNEQMGWRWITWVIVLFSGAMLLFAVARIGGGDCIQYLPGSPERDACELREDVKSGIGLFAVGVVWIGGTIVLGIIWLARRPPKRRCPRCALDVKAGLTACPNCGYDFTPKESGL